MEVRKVGLFACVFLVGGCGEPLKGPPAPAQEGTERDTAAGLLSGDTGSMSPSYATPTTTVQGVYADVILDAPGESDSPFGDPELAVNGVRGGGTYAGGVDVFSLGTTQDGHAWLDVGWSGQRVTDGPGDDLVVFENSFATGPGSCFMDPVIVSVSADGESWATFPVDYLAKDESVYSDLVEDWQGFAGRTPVRLHEEINPVDPFDSELAGGDAFDLADLEPSSAAEAVLEQGVWAVRLQSAAAFLNPDTGAPYVNDPIANGPDIDGVYGRYLVEE